MSFAVRVTLTDARKDEALALIHDKTVINNVAGMLDLGYWHDPYEAEDICLLLQNVPGARARKLPWRVSGA